MTKEWNSRYANYARVHGRSPEEQLEQDKKDWPGGHMVGFVLWGTARIAEYSKLNPGAFAYGGLIDHEAYDAWLDQYPVKETQP